MVLGTSIRKTITFAILTMLATTCSLNATETTDQASLFGNDLAIRAENGGCFLYVDGPLGKSRQKLTPKPPCYFLRKGKNKNIQHYAYKERNIKAVFIIAGTPMSEKKKKIIGLPLDIVCGVQYQGVLVRKDSITVSKHTVGGGACKDYGLDKKFFYPFAHEEWFKTLEERLQKYGGFKELQKKDEKSNN